MEKTSTKRSGFGGKVAAILAAAGSAIGLGNIWRFPYITSEHGGGAFILIYLGCILFLGLPLLIAEFSVGHNTKKNPIDAFATIKRGWGWLGAAGLRIFHLRFIKNFFEQFKPFFLFYCFKQTRLAT